MSAGREDLYFCTYRIEINAKKLLYAPADRGVLDVPIQLGLCASPRASTPQLAHPIGSSFQPLHALQGRPPSRTCGIPQRHTDQAVTSLIPKPSPTCTRFGAALPRTRDLAGVFASDSADPTRLQAPETRGSRASPTARTRTSSWPLRAFKQRNTQNKRHLFEDMLADVYRGLGALGGGVMGAPRGL